MKILAIDPSLTETGVAVLETCAGAEGHRITSAWRINTEKGSLADRAKTLHGDIRTLIQQEMPGVIVIEMPADPKVGGRGGYRGRSVMTAPVYGMGVAAAVLASQGHGYPITLYTPSVNEWCKGQPSTKGDPYKTGRVAKVEMLYPDWNRKLGAKTVAGNIADAMLMARWAWMKWQTDSKS